MKRTLRIALWSVTLIGLTLGVVAWAQIGGSEPGPNVMWNTRYSPMTGMGWGHMGGWGCSQAHGRDARHAGADWAVRPAVPRHEGVSTVTGPESGTSQGLGPHLLAH